MDQVFEKLLVVALKPEWSFLKKSYGFRQHSHFKNLYISEQKKLGLLQLGCGPERARTIFETFLSQFSCQFVLHFGSCGGLHGELQVGDLFLAKEIVSGPHRISQNHTLIDDLVSELKNQDQVFHVGTLFTSPQVLKNKDEKQAAVIKHQAQAVDMESFPVADLCGVHKIPYLSLRGVFDQLDDDLQNIGEPYDKEGNLKGSALAGNILKSPQLILKLPDLKKRADTINKALSKSIQWFVNS